MNTRIIPTEHLEIYLKKQPLTLEKHIARFKRKPKNSEDLEFSLAEAAVFSSMIEGNPIDLDHYVRIRFAELPESKPYQEIRKLIQAYNYAMNQPFAWIIPSEKLYQTRIRKYYENINLGADYDHVNYELSIPFLLMLPMALTAKQ